MTIPESVSPASHQNWGQTGLVHFWDNGVSRWPT
jgi:hypothetical protein